MSEMNRNPEDLSPASDRWWMGTVVLFALAGVLGWLIWSRQVLESDAASLRRQAMEVHGALEVSRSRLGEFDLLVGQYRDQRERLLRQIAKFEEEMRIIGERTQGLERLRDALDVLDATLDRHKQIEDRFLRNLARLEATSSTR